MSPCLLGIPVLCLLTPLTASHVTRVLVLCSIFLLFPCFSLDILRWVVCEFTNSLMDVFTNPSGWSDFAKRAQLLKFISTLVRLCCFSLGFLECWSIHSSEGRHQLFQNYVCVDSGAHTLCEFLPLQDEFPVTITAMNSESHLLNSIWPLLSAQALFLESESIGNFPWGKSWINNGACLMFVPFSKGHILCSFGML